MSITFRSITHGTCLVAGQHPPGSEYARECPVRRKAAKAGAGRVVAPPAVTPSSGPDFTPTSGAGIPSTVNRRPLAQAQLRRARPGRPPVDDAVKKAHAIARQQTYRARKKRALAAANDALLAGA